MSLTGGICGSHHGCGSVAGNPLRALKQRSSVVNRREIIHRHRCRRSVPVRRPPPSIKASSPHSTDSQLLRQRQGASLPGDQERAVQASPARPGGQRLQGRILRGRVRAGPQSHPVSSPPSAPVTGLGSAVGAHTADALMSNTVRCNREKNQKLPPCLQGKEQQSLHAWILGANVASCSAGGKALASRAAGWTHCIFVSQYATMSKAVWEFPR